MPYRLLDPAAPPDVSLRSLTALTVMAKAPRPGRVKTRLSPPLVPEQCAAINTCFLRDTTANLAEVAHATGRAAGVISYTPVGDEALFDGLLPDGFMLVPQRGDGFGERLLTSAEDLLQCGFGSVCLIDSDSPTVPASAYTQAVEALSRPGDRVVLGPSDDGGYYLIGLKHAHPEPFQRITWSTGSVCEETIDRIRTAGLELVLLPTWYDVDDAATLRVLRSELLEGQQPAFASTAGFSAPATTQFLHALGPVA